MKNMMEFKLDGKPVYVEIEDTGATNGAQRVSRRGETMDKTGN